MNIAAFYSSGNLVMNCECIKGYSFKKLTVWVESALSPVICADLTLSQDNCVHFQPIECLLPHINYA